MTDGPLMWFANRGTGLVLLVVFTLVLVLGQLSATVRPGSRRVPVFLVQALHRTSSLLAVVLLAAHIATAVLDSYVDIRWYDALVPWGGVYRPLYLGLGALALDLLLVLVVTSLLRTRLPDRLWRALHRLAYPSWAAALVHTLGIGTDATQTWVGGLVAGCILVVAVSTVARVAARPAEVRP